MGYGACSCECVCPYYTEDGVMCTDCETGAHRGFDYRELDREHEAAGNYDPPDPMERDE